MVKLTSEQKEVLMKLRVYYCTSLSEDPVDGSNFDCSVLNLLDDRVVQEELNHIHPLKENKLSNYKSE